MRLHVVVYTLFSCVCLSLNHMIPSSVIPGDIGGQMGLFIGASILSILEIFDYIYEVRKKSPDARDALMRSSQTSPLFF